MDHVPRQILQFYSWSVCKHSPLSSLFLFNFPFCCWIWFSSCSFLINLVVSLLCEIVVCYFFFFFSPSTVCILNLCLCSFLNEDLFLVKKTCIVAGHTFNPIERSESLLSLLTHTTGRRVDRITVRSYNWSWE